MKKEIEWDLEDTSKTNKDIWDLLNQLNETAKSILECSKSEEKARDIEKMENSEERFRKVRQRCGY